MVRIVPKNARITPGGYGSTSATKRKQRAEGETSPRKTKESKGQQKVAGTLDFFIGTVVKRYTTELEISCV